MKSLISVGILVLLFGGALLNWSDALNRKKLISTERAGNLSSVGLAFVLLGFLMVVLNFLP
jgi:hypothetical protein